MHVEVVGHAVQGGVSMPRYVTSVGKAWIHGHSLGIHVGTVGTWRTWGARGAVELARKQREEEFEMNIKAKTTILEKKNTFSHC